MTRCFQTLSGVRGGAVALLLGLSFSANAQQPLVNGKRITLPPVGTVTHTLPNPIIYRGITPNVGSNAMNLIASPDGKYAVASDMGFRQYLSVINTATGQLVSQVGYGAPYTSGSFGLFYGLVFNPNANPDGTYTLYAAQGNYNAIAVLNLNTTTGVLSVVNDATNKPLTIKSATTYDFPAGLAISADGKTLYVANHQAKTSNNAGSVSIFDTTSGVQVGRYSFDNVSSAVHTPAFPGTAAGTASNFPYAIVVKGNTVYVSCAGDGHVYAINVATPAAPTLAAEIATGSHPIGLLLNGNTLYVSNGHSDTISLVNTLTNQKTGDVDLRPVGAKSLVGVTPNGLALSPDGRTLYAALSDMQAVAMIDTTSNKITGEIPVGWYPSTIVATGDGKRILVANARGTQTRYPNPGQLVDTNAGSNNVANYSQYTLNQIDSDVETLPVPTGLKLLQYTQMVLANNKLTPNTDAAVNPLYGISRANGGITHVFYIIRENRTYDQVLGDIGRGNSDPSLTLFGKDVTPNIHALTNRFVLLDNFFDVGDASMEGWAWTTGALSNEHIVKNQPYNYSSRGANYDSEGTVNNYPVAGFPAGAVDQNNNPLPTLPPIPDTGGNPAGHIWDTIQAAGGTVRDYGAMIAAGYPAVPGLQPGTHYDASMGSFSIAKNGKTDLDFAPFNTNYAESPAPGMFNFIQPTAMYGIYNSTNRYDEWNREFSAMLANNPDGSTIPNFEVVRFGRDHTGGLNYGRASAKAQVADNDYAVGRFIERLSSSPIWKHSAVFILEDDAQNGPDHVDGHRSVGFVISPYIKNNAMSSKFYNTNSFLHTMELLMNAKPLSQYDAIADYIDAWDTAPNNGAPYAAILPAQAIITEVLSPGFYYSKLQKQEYRRMVALISKMDLVHADAADPALLNEMIWKSVKGITAKMPAVRQNPAFAKLTASKAVKTGSAKPTANSKSKATKPARDDDD